MSGKPGYCFAPYFSGGGFVDHKLRDSPSSFFLLFPALYPDSSAWIMHRLENAKDSTISGIRPDSMKQNTRSEPSAAIVEAKSIDLRRISRLSAKLS